MFNKGDINVFECKRGHVTVTRNAVFGAIPRDTVCPECQSKASHVATDPKRADEATHEWVKPAWGQYGPDQRQYVLMGGLMLRKIDTSPAKQPLITTGGLPSETYLEFPRSSHSRNWCKSFDQYLRTTVPGNYKGIKGRKFWFAFSDDKARDIFLKEMASSFERHHTEFQKSESTLTH
ncbi:hypothetical protein GCM10027347_52810 [Larkinella harenae]